MTTIGLRELRQHATDVVRQAEAGETIVITVGGREVAQLGPVRPDPWRRWSAVADALRATGHHEWNADRDAIDQSLRDPFGP